MKTAKPPAPRRRCGAKKRNGQPCPTPAMPNGRCRMHGGASPAGLASPRFRHGRYSQHLPTVAAVRYAAAGQDPEPLSLREEIALLDALIGQLLDPESGVVAPAVWKRLDNAFAAFRRAQARGQVEAMRVALTTVREILTTGRDGPEQWATVADLIERRRRLVDAERR